MTHKPLLLIEPMGFCQGVRRSIKLFEDVRKRYPDTTIFVLRELVHNQHVTDTMRAQNACFVNNLDDVPDKAILLFGAHGVEKKTERAAENRGLNCFNATCPLVTRLQEICEDADPDLPLIVFGDRTHPEIQGILSHAAAKNVYILDTPEDVKMLPGLQQALFISQTTRNADDIRNLADLLHQKIPGLNDYSNTCSAVRIRQDAVRRLAPKCDLIIVVGSKNSSNARRLADVARQYTRAALIDDAHDLPLDILQSAQSVGLATATSTPDDVIHDVICALDKYGFHSYQE